MRIGAPAALTSGFGRRGCRQHLPARRRGDRDPHSPATRRRPVLAVNGTRNPRDPSQRHLRQ